MSIDTSTFQLDTPSQAELFDVGSYGRFEITAVNYKLGQIVVVGDREAFENEFCQEHPFLWHVEVDDDGNEVSREKLPGRPAIKGNWI